MSKELGNCWENCGIKAHLQKKIAKNSQRKCRKVAAVVFIGATN